ncbi:hypothetical protein BH20ACT5_BH20ACT5_15930 [soil metagenome]
MARRLILDTGILVAAERGTTTLDEVIAEDDDLVIAAITVAELRTGVELATKRHRAARADFVRKILETVPVEPYDVATADAHARLLASVHRAGTQRGAQDLIIAATAVATDRTVLTTDRTANWQDLPGVSCLVVP